MFLNKEDTAVLVIDIQDRLFQVMHRKEDLLKDAVKLLKGCQILNLPIVATEQYPKGLGPTLPEIKEFLDEKQIFSKMSFSGYPVVESCLQTLGRKSIILLGIEAHICVLQTCRDLLKNGYQVFVPMECVSSRSSINAHNALELMNKMGAWVTNTETILFDLLKTAEAPAFKEIAKLVK